MAIAPRGAYQVEEEEQRMLLFEVVQDLLLFLAGRDRHARARIALGREAGYHLVEIEPEAEIDFGRAPERALWHVGGHLRVEPDRRRARRIVLATRIEELAHAAE